MILETFWKLSILRFGKIVILKREREGTLTDPRRQEKMALGGAEGDGPAEERAGTFTLLSEDDLASASGNSDPAATSLTRDGYVKTNLTKWDLLRGTTYRKFR